MTPLAHEIYRQLLRHLRAGNNSITYGALAQAVSRKHPTHQRSRAFYVALGEVTEACRKSALPCLPAIVWSAGRTRPSAGYFTVAYPRARTDKARLEAWEREHERVVRDAAAYPPSLPAS